MATPAGELAADELAFRFLSGRFCLNLCATVGERWRRGFERLRTPEDLARWFEQAGVTGGRIEVTLVGLAQAHILREAVYRATMALIARRAPDPGDEQIINAAAAAPPLIPVLRGARLSWQAPHSGAEAAALSVVARDAIDLFTGPARHRIRECASSRCGLLFVDSSRPGRRRWCSSSACGGQARATAYRQRRSRSGRGAQERRPGRHDPPAR